MITKFYLIRLNHNNGFSGIVNDWFSSYSNNRKQAIQVGQQISDKANITCGVPKGPVLVHYSSCYMSTISTNVQINLGFTFLLMILMSSISLYVDKNVKAPEAINIQLQML